MKTLLLIVAAIALALVWFFNRNLTGVKDAVMIANYTAGKLRFNELLQLAHRTGLSDAEAARKNALLKELNIDFGDTTTQVRGEHQFTVFRSGMITGGVDKGYAYLSVKPASTETNLDSIKGRKAMTTYYRHIEGNWYIFLLWDD